MLIEGVGNRYPLTHHRTGGQGGLKGPSLFGKQNGNTMHSSKERPRRAKTHTRKHTAAVEQRILGNNSRVNQ